jgi:CRP-like cAMP-binding protein
VLFQIHKELYNSVPFFNKCTSVEQSFFLDKLKPVLFIQGDDIIYEGEIGLRLFFISKGKVEVSIKSNSNIISEARMRANLKKDAVEELPAEPTGFETEVVAYLKEGALFGELAIFTKLKRTATVTAV